MSFMYIAGVYDSMNAAIDMDAQDFRFVMVMNGTNCDTLFTATTMSAFTLDEYDGTATGYTLATGIVLTGELLTKTDAGGAPNDYVKLDANDHTFTTCGVCTRPVQGVVVFRFSGTFAASIPYAFIDAAGGGTGYPFTPDGGQRIIGWHADGIFRYRLA